MKLDREPSGRNPYINDEVIDMNVGSLKLVYFSPTGTTGRVVEAIGKGISPDTAEHFDITLPQSRKELLVTSESDLLVVGVPVYMGRVPALATEWLKTIQGRNTPAVCVVVYGNRVYDDALLELKDTLATCGCIVVAAAAYIGEHSFSNDEEPIAPGRPDADDVGYAHVFGRQILEKLKPFSTVAELPALQVPGNQPYGGQTKLWDVDFIAVDDSCLECGVCAKVCPVGAVDAEKSTAIDVVKCITCCACIKACPQNARTIKPGPVKDAAKRLHGLFQEPKKPEIFL